MIDTLLAVIDRTISLLRERRDVRLHRFAELFEPLFRDMEEIHEDYRQTFDSLLTEAGTLQGTQQLMELVRSRRTRLEPLRVRVSMLLEELRLVEKDPIAGAFVAACSRYFGPRGLPGPTRYAEFISDVLDDQIKSRGALITRITATLADIELSWRELAHEYATLRVVAFSG